MPRAAYTPFAARKPRSLVARDMKLAELLSERVTELGEDDQETYRIIVKRKAEAWTEAQAEWIEDALKRLGVEVPKKAGPKSQLRAEKEQISGVRWKLALAPPGKPQRWREYKP